MWDFLISLGLNLLIAYLAPKPKAQGPKRYALGEFSFPTADETRPVPLGFGTFKVAGNLIWFGDYKAEEIRKKIRSFPTRQYQSLGYRYKVGMWMTLNATPADELLEIRMGERVVWSGNQTLSKTGTTDVAVNYTFSSTEGQELKEGIQGVFRFFNQAADVSDPAWAPLPNTYMAARLGAGNVPAYPNMLHVVWLGPSEGGNGFISISNNLEPLTFVLRRKPDLSAALDSSQHITFPVAGSLADPAVKASVTNWCSSRALIDGDANPELVKLEVLTSRVPGVGPRLSGDAIELESVFRAADRVYTDGIGTSFTWEQTRPVRELVRDLNELGNAFTELNDITGQVRSKLARPEDVPRYVFDESNLIEISSFNRISLNEAPNEVRVPFVDRNLNWQPREQIAVNEAGVKGAGAVISRKVEYLGVSQSKLAATLASRSVASLSASAMKASWRAFLEVDGYMPKPGDLVVLVHPKHGPLRMRVDNVRFAEWNDRLSVQIEAVQDLFRNGDASLAYTPAMASSINTGATPMGPVGTTLMLRAPAALSGDQADHMLFAVAPGDTSHLSVDLGWTTVDTSFPSADQIEYADNGPTYPLAIAGTLSAELDWSKKGSVAISVSAPNAQALAQLLSVVAAGVPAVIWPSAVAGFDLAVRNHEFVTVTAASVTSSTTATLTISARGIFDTWPQRWAAGSRVMLLTGYGVDPVPLTTGLNSDPSADGPVLAIAAGEAFSRSSAAYRNGTRLGNWGNGAKLVAADTGGDARGLRLAVPGNVKLGGVYGAYATTDTLPSASKAAGLRLSWANRGYGTSGADWFSNEGREFPAGVQMRYVAWTKDTDSSTSWREFKRGTVDGLTTQVDLFTPGQSALLTGSIIRVVVQPFMVVGGVEVWPAVASGELTATGTFAGRHHYWRVAD